MISVVMPAYNSSRFIREAIESILSQTFRDFEFIIVDDGSTDNTADIVLRYVQVDPRVKFVQNDHSGACKARNVGIQMAKYPWIASMDADDVAMPDRLEKQLQAANENPDVVVWGSYMHQINETGKTIGQIQVGPTNLEEFYHIDRAKNVILIVNPTAMFKRDVALEIGGYNEALPAAQDVEFWDRMAKYGPILTIPQKLLKYRLHADSISAKKFFKQRMYTQFVIERHIAREKGFDLTLDQFHHDYQNKPVLVRLRRFVANLGRHYYRTTGVMISSKKYIRASGYLMASIVLNPTFAFERILNRLIPRRFV